MKMTKKATRRLIRKRIAQRKGKDAAKHNTHVQSTHNNSIRGQIMNIAAQNMANGLRPFGYTSQQYGNVNNERRIEQLRNDTHLKSSELQNTNAIIETMQKIIKDMTADIKNAKKEKKKAKAELDKTEHDKDMAEDMLNDAQKMEMKNERLREQKISLERQNALVDKDIHIGELKKQKVDLESNLHQKQLELDEKQKQIESNTLYNELRKEQDELDTVIAQNASYDEILNSDEFKNPNKYYIDTMKQLLLEKEKRQQQEEIYNLAMENKQHQEFLLSQPSKEEYEAVAKQFAAKRDKVKQHSMDLEHQRSDLQDEVDILNYQHDQYMKERKAEDDEQHKLNMLRNQSTYLKSQLDKDGNNKRYAEQIERTAKIHAKGLRKAIFVKNQEDLLKQKIENDMQEKVSQLMNEEPTEEEKNLAKTIGETKARKDALKEQQQLKNTARAAKLKVAEEQANKDYHDSAEYKQILKDNIDIMVETQKNINKAAAMKTINESSKHMEESKIASEVSNRLVEMGPNDDQQIAYHLNQANKIWDTQTEKNQIKMALKQQIYTYSDAWDEFIENPRNAIFPGVLDDKNTSLEVLNDINHRFHSFLGTYPRYIPLPPDLPGDDD